MALAANLQYPIPLFLKYFKDKESLTMRHKKYKVTNKNNWLFLSDRSETKSKIGKIKNPDKKYLFIKSQISYIFSILELI